MPWTINSTDFAADGVTGCTRTTTTDGGDSCEVRWTGVAQPAIARGDAVTVAAPGGGFFKGLATSAPRRVASGSREGWTLTIESVWAKLGRIAYMQPWAAGASGTQLLSIVSVGTAADGSWLSIDETISAILSYAGVSGTVDISEAKMPRQEMRDVTCAAAIRACLRFFPDAVILTNRTTGALSILRGTTGTVAVTAGKTELEWAPRPESEVAGVVINWVTNNTVDGEPRRMITTEVAGSSSGENVLTFSVDLAGNNVTRQSQPVVTDALPTSITDPVLNDWAYKYIPELGDADPQPGELECLSFSQTIDADTAAGGEPPEVFSRMLVRGSATDWMGVQTADCQIKLRLKLKVGKATNKNLWKLFWNNGAENTKEWVVNVTGTTATTQTYVNESSSGGAEEPPEEGLAAEIYSALNSTEPAGSIAFVEADANPAIVAGASLTVASESLTLARMRITRTDAFTGRTTVQFGPVDQWRTPGDFAELQRAQRGQPASAAYQPAAKTNAASAAVVSDGPAATPGMGAGSKAAGIDTERKILFFTAETAGEGGDSVKINKGMVMHQDWGSPSATAPQPSMMYKRMPVSAETLAVAEGETAWLKVTFSSVDVVWSEGPLVEPIIYSVSGGRGGDGGEGGSGGSGGSGGAGGDGGMGGAGGTCECPGGSGSGSGSGSGCDCVSVPGEPGFPGFPGDPGLPGERGGSGGTGGSGSPGSTAEIPVWQKYQITLRFWQVSGTEYVVSSDPGEGDAEEAFFPIVSKETDASEEGFRLEQLHEGILVIGTPTSAVPV